jgi:protein SCO1
VGRPALGGPFLLVDPQGKNVKSSDLKGQWLLLYFGFTFCPDICPNELTKLTEAINILDKDIGPNKVTPVFISIDPERDTPQQVGEYISDWHPRFVALTGSTKQVSEVCKTFRVYHSKSPTGDGADEYLVDHSIIIYLIDDNGDFVDFFGKNKTAPEIAQGVKDYMKSRSQ